MSDLRRCGWENSLAMTSYGERFRMIRRGLHQAIGSGTALRKYHALEETEAKRLMLRLLTDPENLADHIRRYATFPTCGLVKKFDL